jgi:hypothetical protein
LHDEELRYFYFSPNIIRGDQIKEDQVDAVCGIWEMRNMYREIYSVNLKIKDSLEDLHIDGRITLNWIVTT